MSFFFLTGLPFLLFTRKEGGPVLKGTPEKGYCIICSVSPLFVLRTVRMSRIPLLPHGPAPAGPFCVWHDPF